MLINIDKFHNSWSKAERALKRGHDEQIMKKKILINKITITEVVQIRVWPRKTI